MVFRHLDRRPTRAAAGSRRGHVVAILVVGVLVAGAFALSPVVGATAAAQQGAQLTVGVFCEETPLGTFVVTLRRDGVVVGGSRTLRCGISDSVTTFTDLPPGPYTVTETAGPGTNLADYRTFWRCDGEFRSGTSFTVDLAAGAGASCAFLNTAIRTGTLELRKECRGRSTEGRFRLTLDAALELPVRCGERTLVRVPPGAYAIVETAGPGTDLSAYVTFTLCRAGQLGPLAVGGAQVSGVVVRPDEVTVCTVTNVYLRPF